MIILTCLLTSSSLSLARSFVSSCHHNRTLLLVGHQQMFCVRARVSSCSLLVASRVVGLRPADDDEAGQSRSIYFLVHRVRLVTHPFIITSSRRVLALRTSPSACPCPVEFRRHALWRRANADTYLPSSSSSSSPSHACASISLRSPFSKYEMTS